MKINTNNNKKGRKMKEENKIFFQVYSVEGLFMGWVAS